MTLTMRAGPRARVIQSARRGLSLQALGHGEPQRVLIRGGGRGYVAGLGGSVGGEAGQSPQLSFPRALSRAHISPENSDIT